MKLFSRLEADLIEFIEQQKLFFVATAAPHGRINLSPKGLDSLRVIDAGTVRWLNLTGSGNETSAHVRADPRMTLMFCAFDGPPNILRLYGTAMVIHADEPAFSDAIAPFGSPPGARQIFDLSVDLVQTSCGFAVPRFDYAGGRDILTRWGEKKGRDGVRDYWTERNTHSIDGLPTEFADPGAD